MSDNQNNQVRPSWFQLLIKAIEFIQYLVGLLKFKKKVQDQKNNDDEIFRKIEERMENLYKNVDIKKQEKQNKNTNLPEVGKHLNERF